MIRGAIFDVDGTLLDSMPMWNHAGERFLAGIGVVAEPDLEKKLFTLTMRGGAEYIKTQYHLELSVEKIMQGINQTIEHFYRAEVEPKTGIRELLQNLHEQKIPMTIATATDRCHIEAALDRLDLLKYFKHIFTCSEVGAGKEQPMIYLKAAQYMQTPPADTWVFEDAYHAAKTAHDAGFYVVGVYDAASEAAQEQLKAVSHVYLKEMIPVIVSA